MMKLRFSDGVEIDTGGELRIMYLSDGYYVVGEGMSIPCSDYEHALVVLKDFSKPKNETK